VVVFNCAKYKNCGTPIRCCRNGCAQNYHNQIKNNETGSAQSCETFPLHFISPAPVSGAKGKLREQSGGVLRREYCSSANKSHILTRKGR
jgi:hypothetical protein